MTFSASFRFGKRPSQKSGGRTWTILPLGSEPACLFARILLWMHDERGPSLFCRCRFEPQNPMCRRRRLELPPRLPCTDFFGERSPVLVIRDVQGRP